MTKERLIELRADEEVTENGGLLPAIEAIERDIASGEYPRAFTVFMNRVLDVLYTRKLFTKGTK